MFQAQEPEHQVTDGTLSLGPVAQESGSGNAGEPGVLMTWEHRGPKLRSGTEEGGGRGGEERILSGFSF